MSLTLLCEREAGKGPANDKCWDINAFFERGSEVVKIGRSSNNDIVLTSSYTPRLLSSYHAGIRKRAGVFYCEDQGTTHGTYIDNVPILGKQTTPLKSGSIVTFGGPSEVKKHGVSHPNPFTYLFQASAAADRRLPDEALSSDSGPQLLANLAKKRRFSESSSGETEELMESPKKPRQHTEVPTTSTSSRVPVGEERGAAGTSLEDEARCAICLDTMVYTHTTQCSHSFCGKCIFDCITKAPGAPKCPTCRKPFPPSAPPTATPLVDCFIEAVVVKEMCTETLKERSKKKAEFEEYKKTEEYRERSTIMQVQSAPSSHDDLLAQQIASAVQAQLAATFGAQAQMPSNIMAAEAPQPASLATAAATNAPAPSNTITRQAGGQQENRIRLHMLRPLTAASIMPAYLSVPPQGSTQAGNMRIRMTGLIPRPRAAM